MDKTPASFDVFAVSPQGFEVHFQLNGDKVYQEAGKLLAAMEKDGFKAKATNGKGYGNGAHQANGAGTESDKVCPAHNATLRRHQNDKGAWYSHKLAGWDLLQWQGSLRERRQPAAHGGPTAGAFVRLTAQCAQARLALITGGAP